jgi:hypothetical protein
MTAKRSNTGLLVVALVGMPLAVSEWVRSTAAAKLMQNFLMHMCSELYPVNRVVSKMSQLDFSNQFLETVIFQIKRKALQSVIVDWQRVSSVLYFKKDYKLVIYYVLSYINVLSRDFCNDLVDQGA